MKNRSSLDVLLAVMVLSSIVTVGQEQATSNSQLTRPRTVAAAPQHSQQPVTPQTATGADQLRQDKAEPAAPSINNAAPSANNEGNNSLPPAAAENIEDRNVSSPIRQLTPAIIRTKTAEARRIFKTRPQPTGMTTPSIEFVHLAALDRNTSKIHLVILPKQSFLTKGAELPSITSLGTPVTVRILRANGVNTAVTIFDNAGQALAPLLVEYPIERGGVYRETAFYVSAHPAILSPELVLAGQGYVRGSVDLAAQRLREKGVHISPQIRDVAERLVVVEHVDHHRFRVENRLALYQEVYSLFALNEVDTYRYAVSSAGAGGMVQMIPWAYNLMKQRHPQVGLIPDFVLGMQTHSNAMQAMLLYMRDTWNDLATNLEVQYALNAKIATQTELLAAGYNSNAARLPGYLKRGGNGWRTLIPRETQMYLQIYRDFENAVPMKPRPSTGAGNEPTRKVSSAN